MLDTGNSMAEYGSLALPRGVLSPDDCLNAKRESPLSAKNDTKHPRLFPEAKCRSYPTKSDLLPSGHYDACPEWVMRRRDITPVAKLVYMALLHHLRGASTWVYCSADRIADLIGSTRQSVQAALKSLDNKDLIERRIRHGMPPMTAFMWPPSEDSATESEDVGCKESLQGVSKNLTGGVKKFDRGCKESLHETLYTNHLKEALALPLPESSDSKSKESHEDLLAASIADDMQEILGCNGQDDYQALYNTACQCVTGKLGNANTAQNMLYMLASQISSRQPPARNPIAMFLADVRKIKSSRALPAGT